MSLQLSVSSKICNRCGTQKAITDFHKHPKARDGRQVRCKPCVLEVAREYHKKDPTRRRSYIKRWQDQNRVQHNRNQHSYSLKTKYGIDIEQYMAILKSQNGRCAICHTESQIRGKRWFCLDHNHKTGENRGLLCSPCNSAIGLLKDSPEILKRAMTYLEKY